MNTVREQWVYASKNISLLRTSSTKVAAEHTLTPTLFLHGWGGSAESFNTLWSSLDFQGDFRALDLPGFGKSEAPNEPWSVQDYADCVEAYIREKCSGQVHIVAHSFGARIAACILATKPNLIASVVFIGPAGVRLRRKRYAAISILSTLLRPIFRSQSMQAIRQRIYRLIGSPDYAALNGTMKQTFRRVIAEDLSPLYPRILHHIRIIWGLNDSYVSRQEIEKMDALLPNSEVTIIENGKHGLHFTHSEQIARIIRSEQKK